MLPWKGEGITRIPIPNPSPTTARGSGLRFAVKPRITRITLIKNKNLIGNTVAHSVVYYITLLYAPCFKMRRAICFGHYFIAYWI